MIHKTAIIEKDTNIGNNVTIAPYVIIHTGVSINDNTLIDAHSVIGGVPQDRSFENEVSFVKIGKNVQIREFVTIHRATGENKITKIGNDVMIMAYSHIGHNCTIADGVTIANNSTLGGFVKIGKGAFVSAFVPIHQFVRIGEYAFIAGTYRVTVDIPPYIKVAGDPLRYIGVNTEGLKRNGFSKEAINEIKTMYDALYVKNMFFNDFMEYIKNRKNEYADTIYSFFENMSKRPILRKAETNIRRK